MNLPKLIILDRDGVINFHSQDKASPLYHVSTASQLVIKPGVREALDLIRAHKIPTVLATRQRGLDPKLVERINRHVELRLGANFDAIFVEPELPDKSKIFKAIVAGCAPTPAGEIALFDDNPKEREAAAALGIKSHDGADLLTAVRGVLGVG